MRYFFHVKDGQNLPDHEGTELADDAEARDQAVLSAGSMLTDLGTKFWNSGEWIMTVVDELGRTVCALRFSAEAA